MPSIIFAPDLPEEPAKTIRVHCLRLAKELKSSGNDAKDLRDAILRFRADFRPIGSNPTVHDLKALVCLNVIADLVAHGWKLSLITKGRIKLALDDSAGDTHSKEQVRNRHLL